MVLRLATNQSCDEAAYPNYTHQARAQAHTHTDKDTHAHTHTSLGSNCQGAASKLTDLACIVGSMETSFLAKLRGYCLGVRSDRA